MGAFVNMIDTQWYDVYLSGSLCNKVKEKERIWSRYLNLIKFKGIKLVLYFWKENLFFAVTEYIHWISTGENNVEMYLFKKKNNIEKIGVEEILVKGPHIRKWEKKRGHEYKKGWEGSTACPLVRWTAYHVHIINWNSPECFSVGYFLGHLPILIVYNFFFFYVEIEQKIIMADVEL